MLMVFRFQSLEVERGSIVTQIPGLFFFLFVLFYQAFLVFRDKKLHAAVARKNKTYKSKQINKINPIPFPPR